MGGNDGRCRFTLCHELGHLLLHGGGALHRSAVKDPPIYMSSEWQGDRFAGALLAPTYLIDVGDTPGSIAARFGISHGAAVVRKQQMLKEKMPMGQVS